MMIGGTHILGNHHMSPKVVGVQKRIQDAKKKKNSQKLWEYMAICTDHSDLVSASKPILCCQQMPAPLGVQIHVM